MRWYISNEIDSEKELYERKNFYSALTKREITIIDTTSKYYLLHDGRNDNRCMVIGHTDIAFDVIKLLKSKSRKKYKYYLCVCIDSYDCFREIRRLAPDDEIYLSKQDVIVIEGVTRLGCEFLDVGFGFKSTRAEMHMYNDKKYTGFFTKLDKGFIHLQL